MGRDILDSKLFNLIKLHPIIKMRPQSIRNEISRIHTNNHGITMNAAAYVFAKRRGFKVYRYLKPEDKISLKELRPEQKEYLPKIAKTPRIPRMIGKNIGRAQTSYGKDYLKDANENALIYPFIYIIENSLRDMILKTFGKNKKWWNDKTIVKKDIQDYAEKIKEAEKKHSFLGKRGDHPIYYANLEHLYKIVEMNYKTHFKKVFPDLGNLRTWINEIAPIRNLVAHNIRTQAEERQNIRIKAKYICNQIESSA